MQTKYSDVDLVIETLQNENEDEVCESLKQELFKRIKKVFDIHTTLDEHLLSKENVKNELLLIFNNLNKEEKDKWKEY